MEKFDAEKSIAVKFFIKEILEVCEKYKLSISHEDSHGAFIITEYSDNYKEWFEAANDETVEGKEKYNEWLGRRVK